MRPVLAVGLAATLAVAACQGPAAATSLSVLFDNQTSTAAQVGWTIGASADPSTIQFYTVAACDTFRFGFRAGVTYGVVIRYAGGSQTLSITAPATAGTTNEVVVIGDDGVVVDASPAPSTTPAACHAETAAPS